MKNSILVLFLSWLLVSCEKVVNFDLDKTQPKLTIEATIENGQPPVVVLSKSISYFSTISLQQLADIFVHDAIVEVSNQRQTHRLKEYAVPLFGGLLYYYYSTDSSSLSTAFVGELNSSYSLKIITGDQQYSATTTIPNITKKVDSIWWKPMPNDTSQKKAVLMMRATDPPGFGDYTRYWTKKNSENFLPGSPSVYDDLVVDGTTYELQLEAGYDRNRSWNDNKDYGAFHRGDTITIKLSNIDKATYDFWRTMEFTYESVGNPFSTPTKVISNIKGNALGYFGGYASQFHQIIIPQ